MIVSVCWVPKGAAKEVPERHALEEQDEVVEGYVGNDLQNAMLISRRANLPHYQSPCCGGGFHICKWRSGESCGCSSTNGVG